MIPKIIHYCWFGKNPIPQKLNKCINTWKKYLPDYRIIEWNENNFDVSSSIWTQQAYEAKKFAFVADYVRLKVLIEYGGIYLDTDVELRKPFTPLLEVEAFGGFETISTITTGVIAASKDNALLKEFFACYQNKRFIESDGDINNDSNVLKFTDILVKHGLKLNNQCQVVDGFHIYPKTYFCPLDVWHYKDITKDTYAIHYFEGSWLDEEEKARIKKESRLLYKLCICVKGKIGKVYHKIKKDREYLK